MTQATESTAVTPIPACDDPGLAGDLDMPLCDDELASVAHALGHPARVAIVRYLAAQDGCVAGDIFGQLDLAQSTVSQHLRVLKEAGVVHSSAHGNRTYYCAVPSMLTRFERTIGKVIGGHTPGEDTTTAKEQE